ncbi:MAG: hypothetical protein M1821_005299 [Bathelium mastoideum]|nr:MAG: hypothetical protein M1821_005299 [Bathelium mastoideum]
MAKKKAAKGVSNPHLHARISYLYQAANYLSQQGQPAASGHWELPKQQEAQLDKSLKADNEANDTQPSNTFNKERDPRGLSRHLITHMRAASLKTQIRLSRQVKRSLCKRCDSLLVPGHTAQFSIENLSKGGKKPWADTSVIECYPLLGNLPQLPAKHTWLQFHVWSRTYGRLTRLTLASRTHVLLSTEHDANALLRARGPIYSSREQLPAAAALLSRHLRLLFLPYGTRWRRGRKVMHDQLAAAARYEPVQAGAAAGAVAALLARPERYEQVLERYASGLVVRLGFGRSVAEAERTGLMRRVFEVGHTVERVGSPGQYLVDTLPMMMWLPEWLAPWKRELNRLHKRELGLFRELLDDVRAQMAAEKGGAKRGVDCWERAFLEKQDEYELTDNEGAYVIGGLFEAGSGTTAAAVMSWFLAMVLHPEEYRKVQEEVDRSVGESRLPEFEDMEALKTVRAVVKETLRWRPVTAGGVPHQLEKDDVYEGFFLPAGTNIHPNQWWVMSLEPLPRSCNSNK